MYGGEGLDVASFSELNVSGVTDIEFGIKVDFTDIQIDDDYARGEVGESGYHAGAEFVYVTEKVYDGSMPDIVAALYDMEGIDGTQHADEISGDSQANLF